MNQPNPDHSIGTMVMLRSKLDPRTANQETLFIVVEKKMPQPWNKGRPFYYVYNQDQGKLGPYFHDELLPVNH